MRQLQGLAAYLPSYLSSQCSMCSTDTDWFSVSIAFSTGITCRPTPPPPMGTMADALASAFLEDCSKNLAITGCSSSWDWRMFMNSAEPGTSMGRTHCLVRVGFSQLYSSKPM